MKLRLTLRDSQAPTTGDLSVTATYSILSEDLQLPEGGKAISWKQLCRRDPHVSVGMETVVPIVWDYIWLVTNMPEEMTEELQVRM